MLAAFGLLVSVPLLVGCADHSLSGPWEGRGAIPAGEERDLFLVFDDETFDVYYREGAPGEDPRWAYQFEALYITDDGQAPHWFDMEIDRDPGSILPWIRGIYQIGDDSLRLKFGSELSARPTSFQPEPHYVTLTLVRPDVRNRGSSW